MCESDSLVWSEVYERTLAGAVDDAICWPDFGSGRQLAVTARLPHKGEQRVTYDNISSE